jgi:hypothetical protein
MNVLPVNSRATSHELGAIVRCAFVPKLIATLYNTSPTLMAIMGSGIAANIFPGQNGATPSPPASTRRNTEDPPLSLDSGARERIRVLMKRIMPQGVLEAEKKARAEAERERRELEVQQQQLWRDYYEQARQQQAQKGILFSNQAQNVTWTTYHPASTYSGYPAGTVGLTIPCAGTSISTAQFTDYSGNTFVSPGPIWYSSG